MIIEDLKTTFQNLTYEQQLSLILETRKLRRTPLKAKRKKKVEEKLTLEAYVECLDKEELREFIKELEYLMREEEKHEG